MIYSFDLSDFEGGKFTAKRYGDNVAVGGDWVCCADSDEEALELAHVAAEEEWGAPKSRNYDDFEVVFVDSRQLLGHGGSREGAGRPRTTDTQFQVRLSAAHRERLREAARARGVTEADLVREWIETL